MRTFCTYCTWCKFLRLELGRAVLWTPWVLSFRCLLYQMFLFYFLRGNTDSLRVGMCTGYVLEMTVVMMFSLGGDRLYSLFSSLPNLYFCNAMLVGKTKVYWYCSLMINKFYFRLHIFWNCLPTLMKSMLSSNIVRQTTLKSYMTHRTRSAPSLVAKGQSFPQNPNSRDIGRNDTNWQQRNTSAQWAVALQSVDEDRIWRPT